MYVFKQNFSSCQEIIRLLSSSYDSKEAFVKEYEKFNKEKANAEEFYLLVLIELGNAISESNIDSFKKLSDLIDYISDLEDQVTLRNYYENDSNPIKNTNLAILACKHNQVKILDCLFGRDRRILNNLSVGIRRPDILPGDVDETHHNAFYYTIRSKNIELFNMLINKWPNNYFDNRLDKLDEIISRAYEELKLKNVPLSDEMEIFVVNKLISLRFFSNTSGEEQCFRTDLNKTIERIELVLQNISMLKSDYSNTKKVDEKFLFVAKSIAQNIHILKWQLKSTYDRLPWEEIEFCLVIFVSSHTKRQEINLFYHAVMNKGKMLNYLEMFARKLENAKDFIVGGDIKKLAYLPRLKRDQVVAEIIRSYPRLEELYKDYQQIRDIYSLQKISDYINLVSLADPEEREGQLIIMRALQVIGECLKNTLESPKLSNTTSELLLLSLPSNARTLIIDLRDALSHADSLSKRIKIEENADVNFFVNVQNDIKKVGGLIIDILYNNKIKTIRKLLNKIVNSENSDEIKEVEELLITLELDENCAPPGNSKLTEQRELEQLIKELSDNITDKTSYEKEQFNKIKSIINGTRSKNFSENITGYSIGIVSLKSISIGLSVKINENDIKGLKFRAYKALENIAPKIEPHGLKEISKLLTNIFHSVESRKNHNNLDEINILICKIIYITEFVSGDIKWIEKLREKLSEKHSTIPTRKQKKTYNVTDEKYNDYCVLKLTELKNILNNISLSNCQLIERLKNDKKLQAVVEMLALDIMSILGSSKHYLEHNLLFLDNNAPLLTGKSLRNHLAHGNALVDILVSDPSIAIILNAKNLAEGNIMTSKTKIGKLVNDDPFKIKGKYGQNLATITNQTKMFAALEEGNLETVKECLKNGTDILARSINSVTTLHYAAKGPSLEVIKFILDQNLSVHDKDSHGQTALHIAAAYGRKNIVEFFVKETDICVDELDSSGKTPLIAAVQNGHKNTVEVLLNSKANTTLQDISGHSPLHYAIRNNDIGIVKLMIEKEVNVDINESMDEYTPLHEAADMGHLELVNILLRNKANVNAKTDENLIPLHKAAYNGHLEVVNALILNGANVNARAINGYTPLHSAVKRARPLQNGEKYGHQEIVQVLLKNEANANAVTIEGLSPLHFAVQSGNMEIIIELLKHGVDIHAKCKNNATSLYYAAERGHKEVAEVLIKAGAEINVKANNNLTPLHVAACRGHKDMADFLINNKSRVIAQDIMGGTPLFAAALNGRKDIIDLLIKNSAEEVNTRTNDGMTPLHAAALNGHGDAIVFLIKNKAEVNAITNYGHTPLYSAVSEGHKDIVNLLIENNAEINLRGNGYTPLHIAVERCHLEIVKILIANGANVNVKSNKLTPLLSAVSNNHKEIAEILIANGANVNGESSKLLTIAVLSGYISIVNILLKNIACVNVKGPENVTPLHLAAVRGHKSIVNALITRGADIDAIANKNITPICMAAHGGYEEIVEILIASGANVNVKSDEDGTPLHMAAAKGHINVVKCLLENKANINAKDSKNRTPLALAIIYGRLAVVKMLLHYQKIDVEAAGNDNEFTILHIASQRSNLEIVKYLVDDGFDINARNSSGLKAIHIAAKEGHIETIEFFLKKGLSINDHDETDQTLLHYTAINGHLEVTKYLIARGADVNAKDTNGLTPVHIAAKLGNKYFIEVLLKNGAFYNSVNKFCEQPLEMAKDKDVINLLASTEKLFEAVKQNCLSEVEICINAGAFVNAKNIENVTPLHYAARKGYDRVVNVLLQHKANPNVVDNKGITPLHFAAEFSHLKIVKALLCNCAIYNALTDDGRTPTDFSTDKSIISLLKLVDASFENITNGNSQVINDLCKIKDIDTIKAIMKAHNSENKTLVVAAVRSNFSKIEQLKEIFQGDISAQINEGLMLFSEENYQKALIIFKHAFEERKKILGSDNPGTLDIQTYIAKVLFKQGAYQEALETYQDIFWKQEAVLGLNYKDTLSTRSAIALVLLRQGKNKEAYNIYQEVYQKQKELLGPNHSDTLETLFHVALVLYNQGNFQEALNINRVVFEKRKQLLGANHLLTMIAQSNIAIVLACQGNNEDALKIFKQVLEKEKLVLGINHSVTLKTSYNIAGVLFKQKKYREALNVYQNVLYIQKNILGPNHPDTLNTQCNMGNVLFAQCKWIGAFQAYIECFNQMKAVFGPSHPNVLNIMMRIEKLNLIFKIQGTETSEIIWNLQNDINIAANGGTQAVQGLLKDGADANDKDIDGSAHIC